MRESTAEIFVKNPVLLDIFEKYKSVFEHKDGCYSCFLCTIAEAKAESYGEDADEDDIGWGEDEICVVAVYDYWNEPYINYGPNSIKETIDCVFRLIEENYNIVDFVLYARLKSEVYSRITEINNSYTSVYWMTECEDTYLEEACWSILFTYGDYEDVEAYEDDEIDATLNDESGDTDNTNEYADEVDNDSDFTHDIPSSRKELNSLIGEEWEYAKQEEIELDVNGVLINYKGKSTHLILPEGIMGINHRAFYQEECENTTLEKLCVPKGCLLIESGTFANCSRLSTIVLCDSEVFCDLDWFWYGQSSTVVMTDANMMVVSTLGDYSDISTKVKLVAPKGGFVQEFSMKNNVEYHVWVSCMFRCRVANGY